MCTVNTQYTYTCRYACHHRGSYVMGDRLFLGDLRSIRSHTHMHTREVWEERRELLATPPPRGSTGSIDGPMGRWGPLHLAHEVHDFLRPTIHAYMWPYTYRHGHRGPSPPINCALAPCHPSITLWNSGHRTIEVGEWGRSYRRLGCLKGS